MEKLNPALVNPHLDGKPFAWESGPVGVLLVHGFTATAVEVRSLALFLHSKGYSVAAPLLPGHGTTPEECNQRSWQDWYAEVEQTYRRLAQRCEQVIVGGESTGGVLALLLAANHPAVAGLLLYAPALHLTLSTFDAIKLHLAAAFLKAVPKEKGDPEMQWQGYPDNPLKGARELLRLQRVVKKRLADIRRPVFIAQGRLDTTVSALAPQMIYDGIRSTVKEMHWFERSTHCVLLDVEQEAVHAKTLAFLQRILTLSPD